MLAPVYGSRHKRCLRQFMVQAQADACASLWFKAQADACLTARQACTNFANACTSCLIFVMTESFLVFDNSNAFILFTFASYSVTRQSQATEKIFRCNRTSVSPFAVQECFQFTNQIRSINNCMGDTEGGWLENLILNNFKHLYFLIRLHHFYQVNPCRVVPHIDRRLIAGKFFLLQYLSVHIVQHILKIAYFSIYEFYQQQVVGRV